MHAKLELALELARVFVKTLLTTLAIFLLVGVLMALFALRPPRDSQGLAMLAAVVILAEAVVVGAFLGLKRGLLLAIAHAVSTRKMGAALTAKIFDTALGVGVGAGAMGDRGGTVAKSLERIPLAQAEGLLKSAIDRVIAESEEPAGALARIGQYVRRRAVDAIGKYTLTRFREADTKSGGIDLALVRRELEPKIDGVVLERVQGSARLWMAIGVLGLPVAVYVQLLLIMSFK